LRRHERAGNLGCDGSAAIPDFQEIRMLQPGTTAPDFSLAAHNTDQRVSLASFRGRPTIVSFLPFAFTGG